MSLKKNVSDDSRSGGKKHIAPVVTAGFLGTTGVLHFAKPEHYDAIVPHALPGSARFYTYASGAAELGIAGLLTVPTTRRAGALAAIALYMAVFPANVQMAWDWRHESTFKRVVAFGRLPLQLPMIRRAWRIYKTSSRR
jgi:membrane protein